MTHAFDFLNYFFVAVCFILIFLEKGIHFIFFLPLLECWLMASWKFFHELFIGLALMLIYNKLVMTSCISKWRWRNHDVILM